ncbi:MAG: amidohydrolase family protein [Xenococcus sp. MO_188.B8]|nr:amidohydrolase family protein [Xenococcus sp. MO_188.B8]
MNYDYKYVSADNHLNTRWLPEDLWATRLPKSFVEKAPRVIETDGGSFWTWEGKIQGPSAAGSSHQKIGQRTFGNTEYIEKTLPPSNPSSLLQHLDLASIYAAVFFGDTSKWKVEDPELRLLMYRAYNDFCLELSASAPERLIYLPIIPSYDATVCLNELHRVAELGAKAVEFSVFDLEKPLNDSVWEPLWEEAEQQNILLCSHTGHKAGHSYPKNERGASFAAHSANPFAVARPIAEMIFSGVFERYPRLMWVMAECRLGWLPFFFSRMDRQVEIRKPDPTVSLSYLPSDYVRRNIRFTFEYDLISGEMLAVDWTFLSEVAMWACDYPHPQDIWPNPDPIVEQMLEGLPPQLQREIVFERAAKLFGIPILFG